MDNQEFAEQIIIQNFKDQIIEAGYRKCLSAVECLSVKQRIRYRKFLNLAYEDLKK